jgi:hypothetical protein
MVHHVRILGSIFDLNFRCEVTFRSSRLQLISQLSWTGYNTDSAIWQWIKTSRQMDVHPSV